jgi:hypothetical protein
MKENKIRYLKNRDIDRKAWDECIYGSFNGKIYGLSWYLDIVSPGWDGLIEGNYRSIMPITWKKKYLLKYIVQPNYTQQLGIFSRDLFDDQVTARFIRFIPSKYVYVHLNLNDHCPIPRSIKGKISKHQNFLLDLSGGYDKISGFYSTNHKRNLKKAFKHGLSVKSISPGLYIEFKSTHSVVPLSAEMQTLLLGIMNTINEKDLLIRGVYDEKDNLLAAGLFVVFKNTMTYLNGASSPEGKMKRAMFFLMDRMIHENAAKLQSLDFEGSDIPAVGRFFSGFGAFPTKYYSFKSGFWNISSIEKKSK